MEDVKSELRTYNLNEKDSLCPTTNRKNESAIEGTTKHTERFSPEPKDVVVMRGNHGPCTQGPMCMGCTEQT